jgi:arylsulfatase A-like enzyme
MRLRRALGFWLGALALHAGIAAGETERPSIVFVLLDTTRADRFGAWGGLPDTTPVLDALAARGIRFVRHTANAHATRPSMPQLMSGRYYHDNILAPFQVDAHPREMSFARPDPSAALLPGLLRRAGYVALGVSAHTWVAPESAFGREFDRLELLPFNSKEAHGDARPLVDRALALWQARDRSRPLFLYLHLMDMHIPRRLPEGEPRHPVPGYDWRHRFRPDGEADFGRERRDWDRYDATDFGSDDRAHYTAVYDTRLAYADAQLGRLLAVLEADDPGLQHTIVVVTADHGEELGEDGRIEHPASLADGVQHVPWIMAGGPIAPEQRCDARTEHVDVLPTLLEVAGVSLPDGVRVDGTSRVADGRLRAPCGRSAAVYAWEEYRAIRRGRYLLVQRPDATPAARCDARERLYRIDGGRPRAVSGADAERRAGSLRRALAARLNDLEAAYLARRYDHPAASFLVRSDYWRIDPHARLRCVPVRNDTPQATLTAPGWMWTGRGVGTLATDDTVPVRIAVPPGDYRVDAATTPIDSPPWFSGRRRWKKRAFLSETPTTFVDLGLLRAPAGALDVTLPASLARHHVLGLRMTPPGVSPEAPRKGLSPDQQERLRALGYVQ